MKKIIGIILLSALILSSCGKKEDIVAQVGKSEITASEVAFYLQSVKSQMEGTELSSDEDWETKEIEGKKAIELARSRSLETAIDNVLYIEVGEKMFGKLNSEEIKASKSIKEQFKGQFGGEAGYKEFLKANALEDGFVQMLCDSMLYSNKLSEKIEAEEVTDEKVSAYYEENKEELSKTYRRAKHVLILTKNMETGEVLSQEEQDAAKLQAEMILENAKSGADFDALVSEYSQDPGSATNPDGYIFTDGEMVIEFQDGVDALGYGEFGLVKSDFGYHVLQRLELSPELMGDKIKSALVAELLESKMDAWAEEYEISVRKQEDILSTIE